MRPRLRLLLVCASVLSASLGGPARTQPGPRQLGDQKVVVNAGEVPLDVVVRDRKGRAVTDLRASDFEVYEDGVLQQLDSFRLVARDGGAADSAAGDRAGAAPAGANSSKKEGAVPPAAGPVGPRPSAVAIVFDRLSPDARARAHQAALAYVGEKEDLVGVFVTDLSLVVLQPYTDDMQLVRGAIDKAGAGAASLYASNNEQAREVRSRLVNVIEAQARDPACCGEIKKRLEMNLWRLETDEEFQRDQQGTATMNGLLKVAASLRGLPGRKAIIFFSEGLAVPPAVVNPFRALVSAANREQVSVYTVDAAGLRAESKAEETRKEIVSRSALRRVQEENNEESNAPMTKGLERNEDLLNLNPDSGLGRLADETGGSYVTDTNDLRASLRKVDEDLHTYYLLSYAPKNRNYDGGYRRIEVRVKRRGAVVQGRKGYFAINGAYASPVLSYEVPALALLGKGERPDSFPLRAAGFSFPAPDRAGLAPVVVEGRMGDFSFQVDGAKKLYRTDFSVVVLVRDESGQVVRKMSNQYQLSGPLEQLEAAKQGRVLFYREAELAAGRYSFEAVAYDAPTGRASVRTGTLEVPGAEEGKPRLSSVVIVGSVEKAPAGQKADNPFQVGDLLVYPNVGEAAHKGAGQQLPFFFTLYLPPGVKTPPRLSVELRRGDSSLARVPVELPAPDASGRIQYLAALPLEKIAAGAYELKVTVEDGTTTLSRSAPFTVEE